MLPKQLEVQISQQVPSVLHPMLLNQKESKDSTKGKNNKLPFKLVNLFSCALFGIIASMQPF